MSSSGGPVRRFEPKKDYLNFRNPNDTTPGKKKYLKRLPFWYRYPRAFAFGGGIFGTCVFYSKFIYDFFRTPGENEPPEKYMWKGEILRGKTYLEQYRERKQKEEEYNEKMKAKVEALKAKKALEKAQAVAAK